MTLWTVAGLSEGAALTTVDRLRAMIVMRQFEELCLEGVESGEIHGEMHLGVGQESVGAAMIGALRSDDALVGTHRSHIHALAKGVPLRPLLAEIFEKETGLCRGRGGHMHLFDPERNFSCTGIVASSLPVALGYAYAAVLSGSDRVAVGITGDGGSLAGQFHEALNMAGAWRLPLIVVVENNAYAISVPLAAVSATPTIAERAASYRAWGRQVDGRDVDEVAEAFADAVAHARGGNGPAVLEAQVARFRGHYEGDPDHYRSITERERIEREFDPVRVARQRVVEGGIATDSEIETFVHDSKHQLAKLLEDVRLDPAPDPREVRRYLFVDAETA